MASSSIPVSSSLPGPVELDVIVVGAGLSGLATAVSMAQSGSRVTVFEGARELAEVSCQPNTKPWLYAHGQGVAED